MQQQGCQVMIVVQAGMHSMKCTIINVIEMQLRVCF